MLWVLLLLPLLLLLRPGNTASQDSSNPQTMNGILGESVTLSPKLPVGEDIQSITWIHRGRSLIIIMPKVEQFLVTDPKWKHRLQSLGNYSLRLSNLTMEDAGLYCAQITIPTSSELSCYTLKIFRRLSVLNITVHPGLSKTGTCEVHLACSVENSHDALLKWHGAGNTSIYEANLTISWDPRNPSEQKYTCVAENIVSSTSSSVSIQSLCKGNSLSQVPLGALSSCGVWRVLPAQGNSPQQWPSGKWPERCRERTETPAALYLSLPPEASPPSLPLPLPPTHSEPRSKVLGKSELPRSKPRPPPPPPTPWLYQAPACLPHGLPLPEGLPRPRAQPTPIGGLEEAQWRF
uniref:Ig-like domain-containing protein n=1 Tax=Canis lupus familiaris TaxID=9615 RepID=A0A8C0P083_CANLF